MSANSETEVEVLQVFGRTRHEGYAPPRHDLHVTRCDECRLIRHSAVDLLGAHPAVRQRIGAAEIAVHRLESALCALDAVGTTDTKTIDYLTATGADLVRLMDALTVSGAHARWATLARSGSFGTAPSTPASRARWSHLSSEQRQELRNTAARLLARRTEKPVDVLAPSDDGGPSGCMLCGVGAVEAFREDAESVWTLMSADSASIGGPGRADSLDGVVCPRCDHAIDQAHGVGISAMTLSVRSFLGVPSHLRSLDNIDGLIGWAALPAGTAPNREPWAHLDLGELREAAEALIGHALAAASV
ncbi:MULTISPECIES: hypothetical protein [Microbacterium]|uniref:hypothetical protein n=1 Tax=Microbacterium TaxID=33882 RepID=UPI0025DA92A0|nr:MULTISPECIES: hypothetical protein [Microbacterium]